ncbi:MAG: hypothetical protein P8174_08670 [Gemmatimonadota bacterium]
MLALGGADLVVDLAEGLVLGGVDGVGLGDLLAGDVALDEGVDCDVVQDDQPAAPAEAVELGLR